MRELHPYGIFVPSVPKYFLMGSFVTKNSTSADWYYSSERNQFWPILSQVYKRELKTKLQKQQLCEDFGLCMGDIIKSCVRMNNSNLDTNLTELEVNYEIADVLEKLDIEKVFFTSRFVEKLFTRSFKELLKSKPKLTQVTLPSPSPRYASLGFDQKVAVYTVHLPSLKNKC